MSSTTAVGIGEEKLLEVSELVKRAGDEAVQLRVVERFLSEVERRLLKTTPQIFDIQRVRTALQILKTLTADDDLDECIEAEFRLDQEFHLWRELIITRDQNIETYHFRRLCDSTPYPLDDEIFIALAKFYRGLDLTPASQSKFDLSITRLFTRAVTSGRRELRSLRSDNVKRLKNLFPDNEILFTSSDISGAVASIDEYIDEALNFGVFEDMVKSNIFDRYRVFKRDLGPLFFQPEVLAAAVECNVAVGNVFDNLLRSADEQLSSRLTVDVDLAGALHDPSPESRSHINELFRVFFGDGDTESVPVGSDVDYLSKLLSLSANRNERSSQPTQQHQSSSSTAQGRLAPFLRTLTEARPDSDLLLKQMHRSESLRSFDINDFLYSADGNPDVFTRRALGLVLWSQEFREHELKHSRELTEEIQREATSLLYKSEQLADKLQHEVEVSDELNESRLRAVLNALLDSRLKLERGIVRFTNRKIVALAEAAPMNTEPAPAAAVKRPASTSAFGRWLIIMLVTVAVVAGLFFFMQRQFGGLMGSASNVTDIDIRTLPKNEFMKSAYRHDRTLFITAKESWMQRTVDERRDTLDHILQKAGFKFQTVVVMSESGAMLENVSREGVFLDNGQPATPGTQPSN